MPASNEGSSQLRIVIEQGWMPVGALRLQAVTAARAMSLAPAEGPSSPSGLQSLIIIDLSRMRGAGATRALRRRSLNDALALTPGRGRSECNVQCMTAPGPEYGKIGAARTWTQRPSCRLRNGGWPHCRRSATKSLSVAVHNGANLNLNRQVEPAHQLS